MTLRARDPAPDTVEAIRSRLAELAGRSEYRTRALASADPDNVALAAPHDVYSLGLDRIAAGGTLEEAELVGRRFLVMDGERPVASAEVAPDDASAFQANEGRFVAATAAAIRAAEADPEIADGRYELRVLRIPALQLMALWLKDDDGPAGDRVIPLDPAPPPLAAGTAYAPGELLELLREPAAERLRLPDDVG